MSELAWHPAVAACLEADPGDPARLRACLAALKEGLARGDREGVRACALQAVSPLLDYTALRRVGRILAAAGESQGEPLRLAVLGGPTTLQLVELLRVLLAQLERPLEVYEGDYGLFRQEILTPGSGLDRFEPRIIIVATGAGDVRMPPLRESRDHVLADVDAELDGWVALWDRARERWNASVVQNLFDLPPWSAAGHLAARHAATPIQYLRRLNIGLGERAPAHVVLHDLPALIAEVGSGRWYDPRFYVEAKMPCAPECLVPYAHSLASLVRAILGRNRKALVLDLDNTLWGGVVGDVGLEGITVGEGTPVGESYLAFQRYARQLRERGVVLAVCSKNDERNARLPFECHDGMLLRLDDFACFVANWENKADNLRAIARQLDLGLDAFVFADDNPAERAIVRRFLPEVAVPALGSDPAGYVAAVARHHYFETASWTAEDSHRAEDYARNVERRRLRLESGDLDAFLASLAMRATLRPVGPANLQRVAQLVGKSNQFNLTTRRRTLAEIEALAADPAWRTLTVSLADRLGDSGLIAIVFGRADGPSFEIDTWLMSCRVLQRGVERATLNAIADLATAAGCTELNGCWIPSGRNDMVKDHYAGLGFQPDGAEGGTTRWRLALAEFTSLSTHIEVTAADG